MNFAALSTLLLLASTVAATPLNHQNGTWDQSRPSSSFPSLDQVSAGFAMPSGTNTAPVTSTDIMTTTQPTASPSYSPSSSLTESSGDNFENEGAEPDQNQGLLSSSTPADADSSSPTAAASNQDATASGVSYSATFTEYGLGDQNDSPNCNSASVSCGFYDDPGYNAAVSQNLYGAASGKTNTCGTCWQLDPVSDPNSSNPNATVPGLVSIVVKVNNLCPIMGNEQDCGQETLQDTNYAGANVNFDLCKDDGAAAALFGTSGIAMAFGKATLVSCNLWTGSQDYTSGSSPSNPNP